MPAFVDTNNLYYGLRKKFGPTARLDYTKFLATLPTEEIIAYVANKTTAAYSFANMLRILNCHVKVKEPVGQGVVNWNVEIACDILESDAPIILCSSDIHLLDVLKRKQNVQVIAAGIPVAFRDYARTHEISNKMLVKNE